MPGEVADKSTTHGQRYGDWAAPKYDGALLVWPDAAGIADLTRANRAALDAADSVLIHGTPLPTLRREARAFVGHREDVPLVATGHQCELHHPGVWVKNAVACAAATACGGVAYHFAVDTDAPKHLKLRWPGGFDRPITDDARLHAAPWTGLLEPPSPAHLETLLDAAAKAEAGGTISPLVGDVLGQCRSFLVDQRDAVAPLDLPAMTANAQHKLDWSLGLDYRELLLSGVLEGEAWAAFVCHVAADATNFARAYNAALAEYRAGAGIDAGSDRPMPDLEIGEEVELPFWLDDLNNGTRRRASVRRRGDGYELAAGFAFGRDADPRSLLLFLRRNRLRLTTRALSLTTFLRLCVCDLFVHGIGGGHYDQVADRLIASHFGIDPPGFAVATATLFHPEAVGRERTCVPCLEFEGHKIEHEALGEVKSEWLTLIESADDPRRRRATFDAMHAARRVALATDAAYADWQRRRAEADAELEREAEVFDRELFYAVQPRERLMNMIARVRREFAGG